MTLGHGIFVCSGKADIRLLTHELRHVYQYEQAGAVERFLGGVLTPYRRVPYYNAPYEKDPRAIENS